jgi:hypothetical protein
VSKIQDITDAIVTALDTISSVKVITTPDMYSKYPQDLTVFVNTEITDTERLAYPGDPGNSDDMTAQMTVTIDGAVFHTSKVEDTMFTLMENVDKKVTNTTAVNALVCDIIPQSKVWMIEAVEKQALFTAVYSVEYDYNHLSP